MMLMLQFLARSLPPHSLSSLSSPPLSRPNLAWDMRWAQNRSSGPPHAEPQLELAQREKEREGEGWMTSALTAITCSL